MQENDHNVPALDSQSQKNTKIAKLSMKNEGHGSKPPKSGKSGKQLKTRLKQLHDLPKTPLAPQLMAET